MIQNFDRKLDGSSFLRTRSDSNGQQCWQMPTDCRNILCGIAELYRLVHYGLCN